MWAVVFSNAAINLLASYQITMDVGLLYSCLVLQCAHSVRCGFQEPLRLYALQLVFYRGAYYHNNYTQSSLW